MIIEALKDYLGSNWHVESWQQAYDYKQKLRLVTQLDFDQKIHPKEFIAAVRDVFEKCPIVAQDIEDYKSIIRRLEARIKALEPFETYYNMHKDLIK